MIRLIRDNVERIVDDAAKAEKLKAEGFKQIDIGTAKEKEETRACTDINNMSVAELKTLAKKKGMEGYSSLSKDELVAVLKDVI